MSYDLRVTSYDLRFMIYEGRKIYEIVVSSEY